LGYTVNLLTRFSKIDAATWLWPTMLHGAYLELVKTLATRTAELHRALATPTSDDAFSPEPIRGRDLAAWRKDVRAEAEKTLEMLAREPRAAVGRHCGGQLNVITA